MLNLTKPVEEIALILLTIPTTHQEAEKERRKAKSRKSKELRLRTISSRVLVTVQRLSYSRPGALDRVPPPQDRTSLLVIPLFCSPLSCIEAAGM